MPQPHKPFSTRNPGYPAGVGPEDFMDARDLEELAEAEANAADEEYDRRRDEALDEVRRMEEA